MCMDGCERVIRYDAGLIGLQLLRASDDGGEEREAGATWPVDGLNDSSSIISNDEIGPQILVSM